MAIRFYMDVNVPAAITEGLRRYGVDVLTSQEDGIREVSDDELLRRACELGRVLLTQDQDLLGISHHWQVCRILFPGLVFIRQRGTSIGRCIDDLRLIAECCHDHELDDQVVFLPLG